MSFLCHVVKRVDVLLSSSLFMNTEVRLCVPLLFLSACTVNSSSLHLLIKSPTQTSPAVPLNDHTVTEAGYENVFEFLVLVEIKKNKSKCVNYTLVSPSKNRNCVGSVCGVLQWVHTWRYLKRRH